MYILLMEISHVYIHNVHHVACNVDPFLKTTQHMKAYKLWCMHYMCGAVFSEVSGYNYICASRHSIKMYAAETNHVHVHTIIKYTIMYSLTHNYIGSMKGTET